MRTLAAFGITVAMACVASTASATSLVDIVYTGGSSVQAGTGVTGIQANPSDTLSFDVIVQVDSAGLAAIEFDLSWTDPPLSLASASWVTGTIITSFAPFTSKSTLPPGGPAQVGDSFTNIGWFGIVPDITSTQVFLGSVTFHVNAATTGNLALGFFSTDAGAVDASATFTTPNFSSFTVNPVPEPGVAGLIGLGLLTLALAGRRTQK